MSLESRSKELDQKSLNIGLFIFNRPRPSTSYSSSKFLDPKGINRIDSRTMDEDEYEDE